MTVQVSFAADGIGIIYTTSGVLTGKDLLWAHSRVQAAIEQNPDMRYLLIDHSAVPEERIDTESLKQLAARSGSTLDLMPEALVAIVAPNDVLFGLSRMWAAMAENPKLKTLTSRSRDEAVEWLGRELAEREPPFRLDE